MTNNYLKGFESQHNEMVLEDVPVSGRLPEWLSGSLIRNGPGMLEAGDRPLNHWFDGYSQLHRFSFRGGKVSYQNKFLQSRGYQAVKETGRLSYREFATDPCVSLFKRVFSVFSPISEDEFSNNANVNISVVADQVVALTEVPVPMAFDPQTLETVGVVDWEDDLQAQTGTAHPHYHAERKATISYMTHFGAKSHYHVYQLPDGSRTRELIASIPAQPVGYMHSFGISENYAVLVETPFIMDPLDLLLHKPIIKSLKWKPDRGTVFLVINLDDGKVRRFTAPAFATFHHANAFEQDGALMVDMVCFDDSSIYTVDLYLDKLRDPEARPSQGRLWRYHIPLDQPDGSPATGEMIVDEAVALPRINYKGANTKPYRYVYGLSTSKEEPEGFLNQLIKIDIEQRSTMIWRQADCYPSEPVFVQAPSPQSEDDGVVLSVVLNGQTERSFMLVLDAQTFEECARAEIPQHMPFNFHGAFFSA
ncbi:MAG: carotenoid oxygenase family protein [Chloroflexi bacterium]|nr:carotenoid oxygenase family protein [Chloroflexota bacterium]